MSLKESGARAAVLAAICSLGLFGSGCGDYFRPVANPEPLPGGDPQRTAHAVVVSSNGSNPGTVVVIDVSGDTNVGTLTGDTFVGRSPVHAASSLGTDYVVNRDDNNFTTFTVPTVGSLLNLDLITLDPGGAKPVFVAAAGNKVFVAESGLGMLKDLSSNQSITVGTSASSTPVALVATPDGTQLYSLNQGDNTVSVIFPAIDQNVATISLPTGAKPVWGAVSADGTRVFVVNQGNSTVSVIDTTGEKVVDTFPHAAAGETIGTGPNFIVYQATRNRFYVTSPAGKSLSIIDNNMGTMQTVSLAGPPCNAQHPLSVTALADGTRVYVADDLTNSVCVLNTTTNTFTKSIAVGTAPVFIASDPDSTRVFTANSGSGDVSIIQTSSDTTVTGNNGAPLTITTGGTPTFIAITP